MEFASPGRVRWVYRHVVQVRGAEASQVSGLQVVTSGLVRDMREGPEEAVEAVLEVLMEAL